MKTTTKQDAIDDLKDLESMLNDRIKELHDVPMYQAFLQVFRFYRERVWTALRYLEREK